jgi:hypothetical protein
MFAQIQFREIKKSFILEGKIFSWDFLMTTVSGSGGIIRSKIGSKCVDLILIRLAKCWNNFFFFKILYMIILLWPQIYFVFLLVYGRTLLVLQFVFINLPLKLFNFNFMFFFIILWKWQVYDYTVKLSSRNIFFSPVQPNYFLQDSESKWKKFIPALRQSN